MPSINLPASPAPFTVREETAPGHQIGTHCVVEFLLPDGTPKCVPIHKPNLCVEAYREAAEAVAFYWGSNGR